MRPVYLAAGAAFLVACSDGKPTTSPTRETPTPPDAQSESIAVAPHLDPRNLPALLDQLVAARLTRVAIPPDSLSLSPDAVHPDIACPPTMWNGSRCWLMYTPYKNSDASYENPGILIDSDDTTWTTPPSIVNPLVPYPGQGKYNSDPDHAFDPLTHRLIQMYRVVTPTDNQIMLMSTADARSWTTPVVAFQAPNHNAVSPSLIIDADRTAHVWYVRSGPGCTSTSTSVVMRTAKPDVNTPFENAVWSDETVTDLAVPGAVAWHLDMLEMPNGGYISLVVAYPNGLACGNSDLYLATSQDGVNWRTFNAPILWRTSPWAMRRSVTSWYRGTLRYDAATDKLDIWPSALIQGTWSVFHTSVKLGDLLGLLSAAKTPTATSDRFGLRRVTIPNTIEMP